MILCVKVTGHCHGLSVQSQRAPHYNEYTVDREAGPACTPSRHKRQIERPRRLQPSRAERRRGCTRLPCTALARRNQVAAQSRPLQTHTDQTSGFSRDSVRCVRGTVVGRARVVNQTCKKRHCDMPRPTCMKGPQGRMHKRLPRAFIRQPIRERAHIQRDMAWARSLATRFDGLGESADEIVNEG